MNLRERIPHILRPIKSIILPTSVMFFDTETKPDPKTKIKGLERNKLWFGYAIAYRREANQRTRQVDTYFDTIDQFWEFLELRLDAKRPLMVYCHNAGFDLTIIDFWSRVMDQKWDIKFAVLESPPVIISVSTPKGTFTVLDTVNYFKVPLATLGHSVGLEKLVVDLKTISKDEAKVYCKRDTDIIALAMDRLGEFVTTNRLGKLGATVASLAFSAYRHRFMHHDIYIHDRKRVLNLEDASYHGGLVDCKFVGTVTNKTIYKLDVNSLYPTVMLGRYPTKLRYALVKPSLGLLGKEIKRNGVIADVQVETDSLPLPVKYKGDFLYALGSFRTTLVGPELEYALKHRLIKYAYYMSCYDMAPIFRDYVNYFWKLRAKYKAKGDKAGDTFCKYMLNSLYGKFAQGTYEWVALNVSNVKNIVTLMQDYFPGTYEDAEMLPIVEEGQRYWVLQGVKKPLKVRRVANMNQVQQLTGHHPLSFVAIASYVTSYARRYLLDLADIVGNHHLYYYDTDSLFVDSVGLKRLKYKGKLSETQLGLLKKEGEEYEPTFLAPKDYLFGSNYTIKGIRNNAIAICSHGKNWDRCSKCKNKPEYEKILNGHYRQIQFEGIKSVIKREKGAYVDIVTIDKKITHRYRKGKVGQDGWTKPYVLPDDFEGSTIGVP